MAPELLLPTKFGLEKGVPSKEADVYALGMTVYRVLAGKLPFLPRRGTEVIHAVTSGERPHKPENAEGVGMTEVVWDLLRECWKEDRTARPTINHVLKKFRRITTESETADSTIQGFLAAQSNTRNRASVFSQNSSLTVVSCEWSRVYWLLHGPATDGIDAVRYFSVFGVQFPESVLFPRPGGIGRTRRGRSDRGRPNGRAELPDDPNQPTNRGAQNRESGYKRKLHRGQYAFCPSPRF